MSDSRGVHERADRVARGLGYSSAVDAILVMLANGSTKYAVTQALHVSHAAVMAWTAPGKWLLEREQKPVAARWSACELDDAGDVLIEAHRTAPRCESMEMGGQ